MLSKSEITNKYLFHAQRLLPMLSDEKLKSSIELAITLCLKEALQAWLNELSGLSHTQGKTPLSVNDFIELSESDLPAFQHLINLKQEPDTWLSCLLESVRKLDVQNELSSSELATNMHGLAQNLIPLASVEAASLSLKSVISGFKEYINQVRAQHVEW